MHYEKPMDGVQSGLTAKQERFVEEYLIDFNAAAAAVRAGYSKKTARFIGAENLTKPNIQAAIQEQIKARAERTEITADLVVQETWATFKEARAKGKYSAAASLLALLGRHTDAFPNKHEHSGPDGEPIPIKFMEFVRTERPFERAAGPAEHTSGTAPHRNGNS
jgi:phage terminase small subunit